MLVRRNVVRIFCAALALAIYEAVSKSIALGCTTLTGLGCGTGCICEAMSMLCNIDVELSKIANLSKVEAYPVKTCLLELYKEGREM